MSLPPNFITAVLGNTQACYQSVDMLAGKPMDTLRTTTRFKLKFESI